MARKKASTGDELLELVSVLPWWAGVALAVVSYVVLHQLSIPAAMTAAPPGQLGGMIVRSMGAALASVGQYVVPLICLAGAAMSAWRRHQRKTLVSNVAQAKGADSLDGMSWREFEALVGEAYRLQGYRVVETGGGGADGGVDLVLTRDNEKFLVQCKQWKAYKVGVEVVRELYGVMAAKGATGGFVVTSGSFTDAARAFADGRNIKLVDGHLLYALIKQARQSTSSRAGVADRPMPAAGAPASTAEAPTCPVCTSEMVMRTAKKGASAGSQFWGCTKYSSGCRGTRPIVG